MHSAPADVAARRRAFRSLHARPGLFVMPNPWDVGTARILAALGFEALATSSAALAVGLGMADNTTSREQAIVHAHTIVEATDLPVNGDLEAGYGRDASAVVETIRDAIDCGLAGCSIEDATGDKRQPLFEIGHAAARVRAAREAIDRAGVDFVLTARAEGMLFGGPESLSDAIRRLQAYEEEGADVVYAPGASTEEQVSAIVSAVKVPVNVLGGMGKEPLSVARLAELGVKRVSLGSRLFQASMAAFLRASQELKESGTFGFLRGAPPLATVYEIFKSQEKRG
ncbi:MAG: isocitrate lyase/phosphoenolpyruvate mutase family protein [Bauldia sp.]